MIDHFERKELAVKDCYTFTAVRACATGEHPDTIEYFNVTKNPTEAAMQQVNVSRSKLNVIRGIHISGFPKVVFCPLGRLFDVVVDMRPDSPTFKKWCGAWLDRDTHIVCPGFCAHGVFAGEEDSAICYYQGGTFFNHLDYAISGLDRTLEIEWPTPVGASDFVMSEKDLSSAPAGEELWAKIKERMDDPVGDMHRVTNSDVVVVSTSVEEAAPIVARLQDCRVHLLQQDANNRESLRAALVSLRPKDGVIYVAGQRERACPTELLTELLNVAHLCDELKHHLVVVAGEATKESDIFAELMAKEAKDTVAVLVGQCLLYRGMSRREMAERISMTSFEKSPSFTAMDELAGGAVQALREKKSGRFCFVNIGKLSEESVRAFCAANGVDLKTKFALESVTENELNKGVSADEAFMKLISQ